MGREAIAVLSTENLLHNLKLIKEQAKGKKVIAMVKANAYGHGLRSVALRLQKVVDSLGVASVEEGLALRKLNIMTPITLMEGAFEPEDLLVASCQNFQVVFHHETQIEWLNATRLPKPLHAWLKIDSGMGRLGFALEEAKEAYHYLSRHPQILPPLGIMSHLACADETGHALNSQQLQAFRQIVKEIDAPKSLANSACLLNYQEDLYDVIRPGLLLYGISPLPNVSAEKLGFKAVMTIQTHLISIKWLKKGTGIGYGARFVCPEDMPVGIIAMGYGDGYPRNAQNGTPVLVNETRCEIVGTVSMDMITIDLRNRPQAKVGDPVTLWGEGLPIEEVAPYTGHIPYELVCSVQQRVKFYWTLPEEDRENRELTTIF